MFKYQSGVYTDGKKVFLLDVGVEISIRMADGTRRYCPPDLVIWLEDFENRNGMKFMEWAEKYMIMDFDECLKILEHSVYLGELE